MGRSIRDQWGRILPVIVSVVCIILSAPVHSATPSVLAGGAPFGGSFGSNSEESPTTPLTVSFAAAVGSNTVYGAAVPGQLKARSVIVNGVNSFDQSLGKSNFIDHFHLANAGKPDNSTGTFIYTFFLKGTLKIKQDVSAVAAVSINAYTVTMEDFAGYLEVSQGGSTASLYGPSFIANNIFAEADGSTKVYGITTAVGGYFTFFVNFRVDFTFTNFPYNQVPSVDDFSNQVQFELSAISFKNSESDFSATFEFAEQNPIVPSPFDTSLPTSGWGYDSGSGEISLPPPLSVATATGTGDAGFGSGFGLIGSLTALDETSFPGLSLIDGDFPHGFFSFDISGLEVGEVTDLGINLPAVVDPDTKWWFHDPAMGWGKLPTVAVPGTGFLLITTGDGLAGDFSPTGGTISLIGGPGVVADETVFADGFESGTLIAWN